MNKSKTVLRKLLEYLGKNLNVKELEEMKESLFISLIRANLNYYPICPNPYLTVGVGHRTDVYALTILLQDQIEVFTGIVFVTRTELVELAAAVEEDFREQVGPVAAQAAIVPATQSRGQQQQHQRRGAGFSFGSGRGGKPVQGQKRRFEEVSGSSQSVRNSGCFSCGSMDHRVASCPKGSAPWDTRVCFHCREPGHLRPMCPKLQHMSVGSVQLVAVQPVLQIAAVQPLGSVWSSAASVLSAEVGQTSQSGRS